MARLIIFSPMIPESLRTVKVTRYVMPLREGGSLPAIAEANDGFLYVLKFRGAGQGIRSLIAELIGGETARAIGLRVPEIVLAGLDESFGRTEPDEEIQDLLKASTGLNIALHFLSGSISFDPVVNRVPARLASEIIWLDALLLNVDRTAQNTNMLYWNREIWLIDHGASLYFHHNWPGVTGMATRPFARIRDHVLLPYATELDAVDADFRKRLTPGIIHTMLDLIPDTWLQDEYFFPDAAAHRRAYEIFLLDRLEYSAHFVKEIQDARLALV